MKKLKRYIIQCVGTTIVGAICAFVFYAHNQQKYYFPLFILLIFVELFYMYKIYCKFRKNCASVPEERSAIPLQTAQSSTG